MADSVSRPEVWQRGPVAGFDPLLMPVAHAFIQVQEDIRALIDRVPPAHVWQRPGGAASIGFHVLHVGGSVDRLLTYARGEALEATQRAALTSEAVTADPSPSLQQVAADTLTVLDRALEQLRNTTRDQLLEPRKVGRAGLPSTTIGLLFHAAEHATRHTGQAATTARILAGVESQILKS